MQKFSLFLMITILSSAAIFAQDGAIAGKNFYKNYKHLSAMKAEGSFAAFDDNVIVLGAYKDESNILGESFVSRGEKEIYYAKLYEEPLPRDFSGDGNDYPRFVAYKSEHLIVSGRFDGKAINLGKGYSLKSHNGGVFIATYKRKNLRWMLGIFSTDTCDITDMFVTANREIIVCGTYESDIKIISKDYSDGRKISWTKKSRRSRKSSQNAFITKIKADGTEAWTRLIKSKEDVDIVGISSDFDDNIYLAGSFRKEITFNKKMKYKSKIRAAYLVKMSPGTGNFIWGTTIESSEKIEIDCISSDKYSTIILGAFASGDLSLSATKENEEMKGDSFNESMLIITYDSDGSPMKLKELVNEGKARAKSIAKDRYGLYVVGDYFSDLSINSINLKVSGDSDAFIFKLDDMLNLKTAFSISGSEMENSIGIKFDNLGNLYYMGYSNSQNLLIGRDSKILNTASYLVFKLNI